MHITDTVKHLIIINVIFFLGTLLVGETAYRLLSLYFFENPDFKYWQPLTHMFMHGNVMHIAFNMLALYSFGTALEQYFGASKFLFFYISCGLGAALIHTISNYFFFNHSLQILIENGATKNEVVGLLSQGRMNVQWQEILSHSDFQNLIDAFSVPAVGASGAIYGVLVAFAFLFPNAELMLLFIPFPVKAKYFVPAIVAMDLFSGVTGFSIFGGGIAHFAHVGGALFGFLMMWYWKKNQFDSNRWH